MMLKWAGMYAGFGLLISAFAVAGFDQASFLYQTHRGTALGSVTVRQFLATPLKNGRDELDFVGEADQSCVRTLLPHQKLPPCWWLRRHKDRWVQS